MNKGDVANFSAAASDPGNDELTYNWDFADGSQAEGQAVEHSFADNGDEPDTTTTMPQGI